MVLLFAFPMVETTLTQIALYGGEDLGGKCFQAGSGNPAIAGYQLHGNCFSNAAQYISPLSTEKARVAAPPVKVLHLPN